VVGAVVVVVGAVEYADMRLVVESAVERRLTAGCAIESRVVLGFVGAVDSLIMISVNGDTVALELSCVD
jgi:hypothetical protein